MAQNMDRRQFLGKAAVAGAAAVMAGGALAGCTGGTAASASTKPAILVTSFGTSYNNSRSITIGGIESTITESFPDYDVRRAFTAQIIIDKLKDRDNIVIDNFEEAMDKLKAEGASKVIVAPTHLMEGFEYSDVKDSIEANYSDMDVSLTPSLLNTQADYDAVADALAEAMKKYDDGETAICLMGHGTEADSNEDYATMQKTLESKGMKNWFIGTVEAEPTREEAVQAVQAAGLKKAVLRPFMVVAGDHANNDMADEEDPTSWASMFKEAGIEVESCIEGLGQLYDIQTIYVQHIQDTIDGK